MNLEDLGWGEPFASAFAASDPDGGTPARVIAVHRGHRRGAAYLVVDGCHTGTDAPRAVLFIEHGRFARGAHAGSEQPE